MKCFNWHLLVPRWIFNVEKKVSWVSLRFLHNQIDYQKNGYGPSDHATWAIINQSMPFWPINSGQTRLVMAQRGVVRSHQSRKPRRLLCCVALSWEGDSLSWTSVWLEVLSFVLTREIWSCFLDMFLVYFKLSLKIIGWW